MNAIKLESSDTNKERYSKCDRLIMLLLNTTYEPTSCMTHETLNICDNKLFELNVLHVEKDSVLLHIDKEHYATLVK